MVDCKTLVVLVMFLMVLLISTSNNKNMLVDAQIAPDCGRDVLPCMDYLNSKKPPDVCCNPINDIFHETKDSCFCQFALSGAFDRAGVTMDQASHLIQACGVNFSFTSCKASSPALSPSLIQPPATPGSDEGGASMITFSRLYFVPFIWAYVLFH